MLKKRKKRLIRRPKTPERCYFCETKSALDYKQPEILRKFITERGKISSREYSGICSKHQRRLTKEIKKARFLSLLPFVNQIS
ncbi:30S ribosomal protein S18 [Candidatus Shapirobacteria bacterium CG03_land_8_20_14_0_80_40_19]|uniref:Small ribosomal subunit protein bS18 n=4 Tax=Candidatus Shapironibacteriota TaxID=1752721 RepID=A0A2M7BF01_9BACT|nr:MAG: 30S ribosomal protein S18 [Candidatus Shapirobacteria bacterium CG11_big_fil_rev_8_21_14_0_20_40_12]PIV01664.1 MAG: 30S ribosomal protein S18 [Candidatus Shapirobacteria bacterium CG03_land_8_20_14_0_80_40_19]PJC28848.1 MAG: 30S ribosomal protein S18 [Candidatus Shapirobacteria bacterium CG_4_9_14_0_2_um_filter_40_11]PJC76380.1 MAG: 30S ribosomal protein S18 [Candidatus Shapirobacteria bacterium CG_4_8_14_3_um_filter_39_11]